MERTGGFPEWLQPTIPGGFRMDELRAPRPLAVVTGASSGIGYHLARIAAEHGYDLIVAADTSLAKAVADFAALGAQVESIECDLASTQGVLQLCQAIGDRKVDALMANAGHGLGGAFLDQDFAAVLHVINTNVTGTVHLVHEVGRKMLARKHGQVLVTGSIAGFQPGSFHAIYNATTAFVDSFAIAVRNELKGTGVSITLLMPGPTDTEFFERADLMDTKMADIHKADPAKVARIGFDAMLKGETDVVAGLSNKVQVVMSKVLPSQAVAAAHRKLAEPESIKDESEK
jgi:short-subunit dehydrogenase